MDTKNIMIVGVGGQGSLLASKLLGYLLLNEGYDVKVSEVHGMSQRGGSVVTYVRYGSRVASPVIDEGEADFIANYEQSGDLYELIINVIKTIPASTFILILTMLCMIAFYATSFDSIAYTAACYSYKKLGENEKPHTANTLLWCILLIVLPIALVFSESSMNNLQSVSIISAFPIGIIMILMIWSFIKDARKYMDEKGINKK